MNAPRPSLTLGRIVAAGADAAFCAEDGRHPRRDILESDGFRALQAQVAGRSVLIRVSDQLRAATALMALDGVAARLVLAPPDLAEEYLSVVLADAAVELIVCDSEGPAGLTISAPFPLEGGRVGDGGGGNEATGMAREALSRAALQTEGEPTRAEPFTLLPPPPSPALPPSTGEGVARLPEAVDVSADAIPPLRGDSSLDTEWVLFTSGTTGPPKMVVHSLAGLTGAIKPVDPAAPRVVWGTFYDIRRYGGLQILLRALLGGADLVLSSAHEEPAAFLRRLGAKGATHVTGTPSHWRRALMSPDLAAMSPRYARLSGEIADQAVLDSLRAAFPDAAIGHAYASTEAGVGFEVTDEREGFPASFVGAPGAVEMKVKDGSLRVRSARSAKRNLGADSPVLHDAEGFVDSGDLLDLRDGRYYFLGRRGGIINVGGLKIHPTEVEAVINRHPAVSMSLVRGRRNPITGAIVVAEVVLREGACAETPEAKSALREAIFEHCRAALPPFKVPASLKFVDSLAVTAAGKLERPLA